MKHVWICIAVGSLGGALQAAPSMRDALSSGLAAGGPVIVAARDSAGSVEVESAVRVAAPGGDALVDLGSITKTVTAIATLHLMETFDLTAQSTLGDLMSDVPGDKADITLHQLLTHTAGLIESTGDDAENLSRDVFLDRVLRAPLEGTPGAHYRYSNAGYSLLAAIIEAHSGLDYEDYLIDRVLPAGAPQIGYDRAYHAPQALRSGRSWRTAFQSRPLARASWGGPEPGWNLIGNGGLVTTPEGFLSLWASFLAGDIVSLDAVNAALTPHVDEGGGDTFYGYGLVVQPMPNGTLVFWHDGGNEVFSAEWRHHTDLSVTYFAAGRGNSAFMPMDAMADGP